MLINGKIIQNMPFNSVNIENDNLKKWPYKKTPHKLTHSICDN